MQTNDRLLYEYREIPRILKFLLSNHQKHILSNLNAQNKKFIQAK